MPSYTNITINDREDTPVAHVFEPHAKEPVPTFMEYGDTLVGNNTLTISARESNGKRRIRMDLKMPTVQTQNDNGITDPVVVRWAIAQVNFTFDEDSTEQERENAVGMIANALSASQTDLSAVFIANKNFL